MPRSSPLASPSLAAAQPLATYERGRDLCTFVATAASHVLRTLQRPCKSRPSKRKVNHRRFLQNQICRSFADIEAATRRLASSILSQEAAAPPAAPTQMLPGPFTPQATVALPGSFLGTAEAFVAPDQSPSWAPPLSSLMADPGELFEPIAEELGPAADHRGWFSPDLCRPSLLECSVHSHAQPHTSSAACGTRADPNLCLPAATRYPVPASDQVLSSHEPSMFLWDQERWCPPSGDISHSP